jgi:Fe-S cluster assembly iron-binding protein IscA
MMLRITDRAAALIDEARARRKLPEHYGVRVFSGARLDGQGAVQIGFSERPLVGDEVSEVEGTRLFVSPEVSAPLEDLVLDVEEDADSANFVLREE